MFVLTAEQLAFALLIVCSGAVVMLLAGTQILDWYWLVLLTIVGVAISGWRIQKRLLQRYEVARLVDERLHLQDSLSTAWFLLSDPSSTDRPVARHQIQQAETIASGIAAESAFPMVISRLWIATLALIAVIFGLFATRYLVNSSLSLKPALIHLPFASARTVNADAKERNKLEPKAEAQGQPVRELLPGEQPNSQSQSYNAPPTAPNTQTNSRSEQNASAPSSGKSSQPEDGQSASKAGEQNAERSASQDASSDSNSTKNSKNSGSPQQDKEGTRPKTADGQQTPGLMDKMRDALSGLMAKLQRNSGNNNSRDAKNNSASQKGQAQQNAGNKKQNGAPDQNGQKAESSLDSQSSAQAAAVEKTPASSVGSSNEEMPQTKTSDPQSGAGRQDGQKDLKAAEQLRAMGKLAEIIGKRSANLTGDIKVEKPTQEQQLETQYSNQVGRHTDNGGEINRDEVPAEYQSYVRAYMKEVHKQANATK